MRRPGSNRRNATGSAAPAHAHAHAHDADPPTSLRGRRALVALVALVVAATVAGLVLLWPPASPVSPFAQGDLDRIKGTVTALEQVPCSESAQEPPDGSALEGEPAPEDGRPEEQCVGLAVRIDQGPEQGATFDTVVGAATPLRVGQGVVLYRGDDPTEPGEAIYQFADVQRAVPLIALAGIFLLAILALGRLRGLLAVVGLGASLLVLVKFLVPALLAGRPPVLTAVIGASAGGRRGRCDCSVHWSSPVAAVRGLWLRQRAGVGTPDLPARRRRLDRRCRFCLLPPDTSTRGAHPASSVHRSARPGDRSSRRPVGIWSCDRPGTTAAVTQICLT